MFYTEIQDGHQKFCENDFWQKVPDDSPFTMGIKKFVKIALFHTLPMRNMVLRFTQKLKMAAKNGRKSIFYKNCHDSLPGVKNFIEITLSHTISKINTFFVLYRISRWPTKMAGKLFFWQKVPDGSADTLGSKIVQIALSCFVSKVNAFLDFTKKFLMAAKNGRKPILGKKR